MRIALAAIFQITNTFARQQSTMDDFVVSATGDSYVDLCDPFGVGNVSREIVAVGVEMGHTIEPVITAIGRTGGPVTQTAMDELCARLGDTLAGIATEIDAVILILSGAGLCFDGESVDGSIVAAARSSLSAGTPIVAIFSPEARLSEALLESVDLPLVVDGNADELESIIADRLELVRRLVESEMHPASQLRRVPLLLSYGARVSGAAALYSLGKLAGEFSEDPDVVDASFIPGFSYADVPLAGAQVLVTTDGDSDKAARLADRLRSAAWDLREELTYSPLNVETVVHDAMLSDEQPVVIFDAGDDPTAGGAGDGTGLLWALIDLGVPDAALGVIVDAAVVARSIEIGAGATLHCDIGGTLDRRAGYPISVAATVSSIVDDVHDSCPSATLAGRAVLLDVQGRHGGRIDVVVTERAPLSVDLALFEALGVDLGAKRVVGVKSSGQNRALYASISRRVLSTSTPGITTPSLGYLEFQNVSRPVFPLDDGNH